MRIFLLFSSLTLSSFSFPAQAQSVDQALESVDALFEDYFLWFGSMFDRHSWGADYSTASRENPH
jgi:hypothetical protein